MINKNILHIIIDNTALNKWKNKVSKINKQYKQQLFYLDNYVICDWFYFNFRYLHEIINCDRWEIYHCSYQRSRKIYTTGKYLPKYYVYSSGSQNPRGYKKK